MNKVFTLALLLCAGSLFAQSKIKVLNKINGEPVANAKVVSLENKGQTFTNVKGEFNLSSNYLGGIEVSHINFETLKILALEPETTIYLQPTRIAIQEIIVLGNLKLDPMQAYVNADYTDRVVQPKNAGELFSNINGFSIIRRGNYALDPAFRASQYEQLNIMFDGGVKAMQACPNRMDPITTLVNPEEVERIEIIKGPFSVRYGNTFGGIINMVTSKPSRTSGIISGNISSGFESNGNATVNHLQIGGKKSKFDYDLNFSHRDYGNYEDGKGREIPSSFRSLGYGLKAGYSIDENQYIKGGLRQSFGRDVLHAGLMMDTEEDNSTIASLDYRYSFSNSPLEKVTFKAYYSIVDHIMSNYRRPSFQSTEAISDLNAVTYGGKLETKWKTSDKLVVFAGLDVYNISRDGSRNRLVKRSMDGTLLPQPKSFEDKVWQDSYVNNYGTFVEATFSISEKSVFKAGARFDHIISDSKDPDANFSALYPNANKRKENYLSGTISYRHLFSPNYHLDISIGRGIRPANMEERYIAYLNIGRDPYEYVGNPFLDAEVNNQFEIGFKGREHFKNAADFFEFGASAYYSKYENYIVGAVDESLNRKYMPMKEPKHPKVFQNLKNAFKTGVEVYTELNFLEHYKLGAQLAYVYTENEDFGEALPLTPPLISRFNFGYTNNKFWTALEYKIVAKQSKISQSFGETETDGYDVLDFKTGIELYKGLKLGLGVLNIFDTYYNDHLNFSFSNQESFERTPITEPGRNFTAFINYKF